MNDRLQSLAAEFWEFAMETSPLSATLLGDHRYDDQVPDLTAEREAADVARLTEMLTEVDAIDSSTLDRAGRVTQGMLANEIQVALLQSAAFSPEMASDQMLGYHSRLMRTFPQTTAPEPVHAEMLVDRYGKLGTMLDQGLERFREGLAKDHTPARINIERSLSQLDAYLASPLDGDLLAGVKGPADWKGEAAWREAITEQIATVVRPALERYRAALRDELLPAARGNDRAGLKWMTDGDDIYRTHIQIHTSLELSAQEIHDIGRHDVEEVLPRQYEEIGGRALGLSRFSDILEALRANPEMMYRDAEQMMEMHKATLARALAAVPDWFGATPQAVCQIVPVPDAIAADVPAAYYFPPAPDGSRPGTYFLNTHNVTERNMFEAESIAFHEAIPGHHFQLALSAELANIPMFQRYATATAFVEGWGLYTERLADEMGLYSSDIQRLGMLSADSWRGCRLVVDTGLHFLGWSRDQAIEYMSANTPVRHDEVAVEVDRYIGLPGQALAYKIGQREIFRLREQAKATLGGGFDIREFHDVCLTSGSITLPILAELVDGWVESKS